VIRSERLLKAITNGIHVDWNSRTSRDEWRNYLVIDGTLNARSVLKQSDSFFLKKLIYRD
jgi:hypothetical protein